jgi:ISXO2-like transposase domain/Transposase zinc-ribbon domain
VKYPENYRELVSRFSTQESCIDYIAGIRWKDGFICSSCGSKNYWRSKRLQWICSDCKLQHRVLSGTLFQDTKLPLSLWFQMIWWFMGPKNGVSALALKENFGVGSYRTAWVFLDKLRQCTVSPNRDNLSGKVEADEVFLGGYKNKELIGVAAEIDGNKVGRIRLKHLKNRSADEIQGFIKSSISLGSTIVTDRHKSYISIIEKGYGHNPQRKPYYWEEVNGDDERLLPRVHRVASLLKRWYYGTYQGRIDIKNLQPYLDEFVFRFNRRTSASRGLIFYRMIESAINSKPRPR